MRAQTWALLFIRARYMLFNGEYLGGINMLTVIKIKFQLAKLKYYTRKETKAFHKGEYDKAVKYGKIVGSEFDKLFG